MARRVPSNCFDPPNPSGNGLFLYYPEWADLAGRPDVGSATQLHRITIEAMRYSADLQNAHCVAVFLSEKLDNVGSLLRFRVGNLGPGDSRILLDLLIHQFFYVAHLLLR